MILSNCLGDIGAMDYDLTEAQLKGYVSGIAPGEEEKVLALYRRTRGTKSPFRIRAEIQADTGLVQRVDLQAVRKAALKAAPVYRYQWDWSSRALDGRMGPIHHMDVPPSMAHPYHAMLGGGGDDARAITEQMASVVVAFAKTGNPNNAHIPNWSPLDDERRATKIFDAENRLEHDPRSEIRKFWLERKRA
jgi:para-nitrobenzyl esterase